MRASLLLALCFLIAMPACAAQPANRSQPQQLRGFDSRDITIERRDGRDSFRVWLALTPAQQQQGLMWIRELPRDAGMLFMHNSPRPMDMWMKNTYVPLDMLFFDSEGRITHIHRNATPQSEDLISSNGPVAGVLELLAGEADRRGIRVGDRVALPRLSGG
jgi:uncharacterized membrane protein (UPF0127 family)